MLDRLYSWYGKRVVLSVALIIVLLIVAGITVAFVSNSAVEDTVEAEKTIVTVKEVKDIVSKGGFTTVGKVSAVSEARLRIEVGGQIKSVNTEIGKTVPAGFVIASVENSAQSASVLQAQGAYEAAQAGAASGVVGTKSAEEALSSALTSAITAYQSTLITTDAFVRNDMDDLFTINNGLTTGLKIDADGQAPALNEERNAIETVLTSWLLNKDSANALNITSRLETARKDVLKVSALTETLSALVTNQDITDSFTQANKDALESSLYAGALSLNAQLQAIEGSIRSIESAQKAVEQAKIAGASNVPSASSAQVKIALGSLRSAQSAYEKTLVRTPIAGVVNALYLKAGEYASPSQEAAVIANNNGLQIETAVSEKDSANIAVGDRVDLENGAKGTITAIAPALDPVSGTITVKVSVDDESTLTNGSTVTMTFVPQGEPVTEISVPLSALKMTSSGPVAFVVGDNNTLTTIAVELGAITGDSVVITKGLTLETKIVTDARGLQEGEEVTVVN